MFNIRNILKIIIVLILSMNASVILVSQENIDYPSVNSKTYNNYLSCQWTELIKTGKKSRQAGIDFYYLQVRMGIAYYNLKKYRQAIPYLESAFYAGADNEFVGEYLYHAYLFSGRYNDAQQLAKGLSEEFCQNAGIKQDKGITGVTFDIKFDSWDNYKVNTLSSDTLIQYVQNQFGYFSLGFDNTFKNTSKLYLNYSRVAISESFDDFNASYTPISGKQEIYQHQFYLSYGLNLGRGTDLFLSGNLLDIIIDRNVSGEFMGAGNGNMNSKTSSMNFAAYAALYHDFSLFKVGIFSSFSNLYKNLQIQPGVNLTFYPLGNTNLYTISTFHYQIERIDGTSYKKKIFKQAVGLGLWGVHIEPSITFGELSNFIEADGLVVNNGKDIIKNRHEILAYSLLFKGKLNLFFKYQNYVKQNYYVVNNQVYSINYNYQTITGGLKWNF